VARIEAKRNVYRGLLGKTGERLLGRLGVDSKILLKRILKV
jgi:hypothetical protein